MSGVSAALCAYADTVPADHAERMAKGLELFKKEVRPLLDQHCLKCHGGEKVKSELDLATREGLLHGGKEGVAVRPFDAAGSWLMKLIRHEDDPAMPDKKPKLSDESIAKIGAWIDLGAPYDAPLVAGKAPPRDRSVVTEADRKWWAFQPLAHVTPPAGAAHPVDAFLLKAAEGKKLGLNPPADRRLLIRRAYFDLLGLPPPAEEVEAFAADTSPEAWPRLVDRLLESPAYGERWGRHWLDVARFAESSGFEHDIDRPYAYYYRDFVIKALNSDMPFDQFTRWQLAGDEFEPNNPFAMMGTGFLGAGVFPTQITANEVERTRYDALDDMLSTTGVAFLGLTVGCARCHDHKYDPIPTADYYRLLSTFTTTVRSNVDLSVDPEGYRRAKANYDSERAKLDGDLTQFETKELRPRWAGWLAAGAKELPAAAWTQLDVSGVASKAGLKLAKQGDGSWLAKGKPGDADVYTISATTTRRGITGVKLEALTDKSLPKNGPGMAPNGNFALSRITVTAAPLGGGPAREYKLVAAEATHQQNETSLSVASALDDNPKTGWAVDGGGIGKDQAASFTLAEPIDFDGGAKLTITLEFSVNTGHSIGRPRLSIFAGGPPALKGEAEPPALAEAAAKARTEAGKLTPDEREVLFAWWKARDAGWTERHNRLVEYEKTEPHEKTPVMLCAEGFEPIVMHSQGPPFLPETYILKRGDVNQKQVVATQGFLQVLERGGDEKQWQWTPPAESKSSGRRRSLANWITDVDHGAGALLARVAANRLWQHHFGRGLVATPNDFGKTGALPSHPELLDWLAGKLIRDGWRLKPLHRLLMTSAAYQQSDAVAAAKAAADPDNALFLRRAPQRLEAEAVRDNILEVSGELEPAMYGPGTLDESSRRRSIYFMVKRSRLINSMVVFDAPEPLASQGMRPSTTVAPQALLLMNSPQVRAWALAFAKRVEGATAATTDRDCPHLIDRAYRLALGRPPRESELREEAAFLREGIADYTAAGQPQAGTLALADLCQTLFALNEFIYVQ
jgi:mono/diheme cytochrome c family protein